MPRRSLPLLLCPLLPLWAQGPGSPVTVPAGTRLELMLPQQTRLHKVGQVVDVQVTQPVFVANRLVLPVGSVVQGTVMKIQRPKLLPRVEAGMGGDFSPAPSVRLQFTAVRLSDGTMLPIVTSPAPQRPALHMVSAGGARQNKMTRKFERQISAMYHQQEDAFESLIREQTHWQTLKQEAWTNLPWRPASIPAGASFAAVLTRPVEVADAPAAPPVSPEEAGAAIAASAGDANGGPDGGLEIHARLDETLSSATAHWGEAVTATLDRPTLDAEGRIVIPEGTKLEGSVAEVHRARWFGRGGKLRFDFTHLKLPASAATEEVPIAARLTAASVRGGVQIGAEGDAKAAPAGGATPYVALSVVMLATVKGDSDNAWSLNAGSGTNLHLWGTALTMVSHSWQPIGLGLGFAGAGRTIYRRWIGRGPQMVFPKDTALDIKILPPGEHGKALKR